ncbi:hypothetical protein ASF70_18920 [Rhizobium sp. Leaf321]|uniref:hypothetical protein n=1 Tax=Rhizobium sp. Leaf321 TaxID=1736335 RepID=UPI0007141212|nr:hypothetical protein [Rhizobium sp. Leaf321]KQQ70919.1 hypothetical protein ASF70_18920 [Rhizobium sp. Leaf321]
MRVKFTDNFDYKPTSQSTIGYLAGMEETVKRECGEAAIAAGKAEELTEAGGKPSGKSSTDASADGTK